jgi:hypothetical protein
MGVTIPLLDVTEGVTWRGYTVEANEYKKRTTTAVVVQVLSINGGREQAIDTQEQGTCLICAKAEHSQAH